MSVFADHRTTIYRTVYQASILVDELHGGIPQDPRLVEGWIRKNLGAGNEELIADMVAETLIERGATPDQISDEDIAKVASQQVNGFKRLPDTGELYIEGRQIKAMLKEAANIAVGSGLLVARQWGKTNKGLRSFFAEHIFVPEKRIGLGVTEPSGIHQRFVATFRGTGIQLEEYVSDAKLSFTVATDWDWPKDFWPTVWVIAEQNGLGASRAMGFGTFDVTDWTRLWHAPPSAFPTTCIGDSNSTRAK